MSASNNANTSKGLRVIADNLDATCMLRLSKTGTQNGELKTYTETCTGILVKEGFILTSSRVITSAEDVADGEAVFFYESPGTTAGRSVHPVSIPLDPGSLFYQSPIPVTDPANGVEAMVDETHLGFTVLALDRNQIRPFIQTARPTTATLADPELGLETPAQAGRGGQGRPSSAARRKSKTALPSSELASSLEASLEDAIIAFQEIVPIDMGLNGVDLSQGEAIPKIRVRDPLVVVEHRQGGPKDFHNDVCKNSKELTLEYTLDRSPRTDARSVGSPIFAQNGQLVALLSKVGNSSVSHQCVRLGPILSNLRAFIKRCRINSAKTAKRGDFMQAAEFMWLAVSLNPSPAGDKVIEGLRLTADILTSLKNEHGDLIELDEALECHSMAIQFSPCYTDAYLGRGLVLHMQTKYADAVRDFSSAIQLEASEADFYYYRGHAFYDMEQLDNAIADYNTAIRLVSTDAVYYLNRGNAHTDKQELELAKKDYTSCIRLAPEDENAYFRRGNVLRMLGQLTQAIQDYTQVLTLVPEHAAASYQRGLCYYQKAHIDVSKAYKWDPQPEYKRQLVLFRKPTNT